MEDFKILLMQLVETIEWQDPENCKSAAKNIMDHFSEKVGNMSRSIISGIYNDLYAGFDAVSDSLKEKGINGINLWTALHHDVYERYGDKRLVMLLTVLSIIAQEARCYNDVAFKKYQENNIVDEASVFCAVERLVKMRPYALGIPAAQYSIDEDVSLYSKRISAVMFANSFRQLDLVMYNKDQIHDIFIGFFNDFVKSKTIIDTYGQDLIECAEQLMKPLDVKSKYMNQYLDICIKIKGLIK
jgi:hypothetical protein